MNQKTLKLKWAKKVLQARHFVILTDKSAIIMLDAADPSNIRDRVALKAQLAELQHYQGLLNNLIKDHQKAVAKLGVKRVVKIPVKQL